MGLLTFGLITGAALIGYALYSICVNNEDRPSSYPSSAYAPIRRHDDQLPRYNVSSYPQTHTPRPPPLSPPQIPSRHLDDRRTVDSHSQIHPSRPPRFPSPQIPSHHLDDQIIEVDYSPVETSASLRAKARQEGNLRSQCYQQSKEAYKRNDHVLAKKLSERGKRHARQMERYDAKASAMTFRENNESRPEDEVDLHGLHVKEAIYHTEKALKNARRRGDSKLRLIVGQGNHSDGGVSRLKPALLQYIKTRGIDVDVEPRNPGVLRVVI